jgi:thymidine phosphorylase
LESGAAYEKFGEMVRAQGGDLDAPRAVAKASTVIAGADGFVSSMDCEALGQAVVIMGGGRWQVTDRIDSAVGLEMLVRIGAVVERGQPLVRIFAPDSKADLVHDTIAEAIVIGPEPPPAMPLIRERISPC